MNQLNGRIHIRRFFLLLFSNLIGASVYADSRVDFLTAAEPLLVADPQSAFKNLQVLADSGNADAAVEMSRFFREAYYGPVDTEKACAYAQIAHKLGSADGAFEMAECLKNSGSEPDASEVAHHMQVASERGSARALTKLSCTDQSEDDSTASEELQRLNDSDMDSMDSFEKLELARFKYYACGTSEDISGANMILSTLNTGGFGAADHLAGLIAYYFDEIPKSRSHFSNAIKSGYLGSVRNLYFTLSADGGVSDVDLELASPALYRTVITWTDLSAASCMIFDVFRLGLPVAGIERDDDLAFEHAQNCALREGQVLNATALNWLAIMHSSGYGTKRDARKGLELYALAYENGDPYSAMNIGEAYEEGDGVELDYSLALTWYQRSFEAFGDDPERSKPLFDIGRLHELGHGVSQDYKKAADFYRQSIALNPDANPIVYIRLADLIRLELVSGTAQDAKDLYLKATEPFPLYESLVMGEKERSYKAIARSKLANIEVSAELANVRQEIALNSGDFYALLFGADDYVKLNDLSTPIQDARDLARTLRSKYGFDTTLIENPSRRDILGSLSEMRKLLGPEDNLLIYFAGHGVLDEALNMGFWQPVEAEPDTDLDWIPTDRITRSLRGFRSSNIMVVADSCYSAAIIRGGVATKVSPNDLATLQGLIEKKTRVALTSGGLAPVADNATGGKNSVFASALNTVLESASKPITATEIFSRVRGRVAAINASLGFDQAPEFSTLLQSGHEGGDFVFVPKN